MGLRLETLSQDHLKRSLRIAFVVNPFRLRRGGAEHAPVLSRELLGLGHHCRGFGAAPGVIPRSRADMGSESLGLLGYSPDVIVAYDAHSPAGWQGARCARRLHVPLIAVEEGVAVNRGGFGRVLRSSANLLWGARVRQTVSRLVSLDAVARTQAIQAGYRIEDIELFSPGVDLTRYRPGLRSDLLHRHGVHGRALLVLSPLEEGRGLEETLEAFAQTVGRREDWDLVFAGGGSYRAALRAHAARLGVGAQVHWIGQPRDEELPGLLGSSVLLLVPGQDSATSARHLRLAMASGLPALATDEPRFSELVQDDRSGLLVQRAVQGDWVRALEQATRAPQARERWGLCAREIATERLAWPRIAARFAELLGEAVVQGPEAELRRREWSWGRRA